MKPTLRRFFAPLLLGLLSVSVTGLAQHGRQHPPQDGGSPARREMAAYVQANVLPVVRQQRQKLESQLSAADRAQLSTYRTQLQDLKLRERALRKSFRPAAGSPPETRPALTEAQREQVRQLRTETQAIRQRVAQLARQYEGPIKQLAQEVQPQKEKWAADLKAIASKSATPGQHEKTAPQQGQGQGQPHGRGPLSHYFRPAAFLLMHPNAPAAARAEASGTSFFPNPAAATSQLTFNVKKAGPVSVDLLDQNGNTLRALVPPYQAEKGAQTQQLDLRDLPAGTYFYKIMTKAGTETRRFVKE